MDNGHNGKNGNRTSPHLLVGGLAGQDLWLLFLISQLIAERSREERGHLTPLKKKRKKCI